MQPQPQFFPLIAFYLFNRNCFDACNVTSLLYVQIIDSGEINGRLRSNSIKLSIFIELSGATIKD